MHSPKNDLLKFRSILPIGEIQPESEERQFSYDIKELPQKVSILLKINRPASIKSGTVKLLDENLFWIASQLKLILFSPIETKSAVEINIEDNVAAIFSHQHYLLISHPNSSITIVNFPHPFSEMFPPGSKNEFSYLNCKTDNIPYLFHIVSASKSFVGTSNGEIYCFYLSGHWNSTHFLLRDKPVSNSKLPITQLIQTDKYLYAINSQYELSVYLISDTKIPNVSQPIKTIQLIESINWIGKFAGIQQFNDSIVITKEMGGQLLYTSVLLPTVSFHVENDGVIIGQFNSNDQLPERVKNSHIYRIISPDPINSQEDRRLIPIKYLKGTKVVTIFFRYDSSASPPYFQCDVKKDDVIIFAYENFFPTPFISPERQLIPLTSTQGQIDNYKCIDLHLKENFDVNGIPDSSNSRGKGYLRVIQEYSVCGKPPNVEPHNQNTYKNETRQTIESLYGFDKVTGSAWGGFGSVYSFYNTSGSQTEFATMKLGCEHLLGLAKPSKSSKVLTSLNVINTNSNLKSSKSTNSPEEKDEKIIFFTTTNLICLSLTGKQRANALNTVPLLKDLLPFWMKPMTINNMNELQNRIVSKYFAKGQQKVFSRIEGLVNKYNRSGQYQYLYESDPRIVSKLKSIRFDDLFDQEKSVLEKLDDIETTYDHMKTDLEKDAIITQNNVKISRIPTGQLDYITSNSIASEHSRNIFRDQYLDSVKNENEFSKFIDKTSGSKNYHDDEAQVKSNSILIWSAVDFNERIDQGEDSQMNEFFAKRFEKMKSTRELLPFD